MFNHSLQTLDIRNNQIFTCQPKYFYHIFIIIIFFLIRFTEKTSVLNLSFIPACKAIVLNKE